MIGMKVYAVTLKSGTVRYYGFDGDCEVGDTVATGTSHGPILGQISGVLDELPDYLDEDKMRYILCYVSKEAEVAEKPRQVLVKECLSKLEQKAIKSHISEIEQMMDEFMERRKKEVMRLVFADYNEDFKELAEEVEKLNGLLYHSENKDTLDYADSVEMREAERTGHCSDVSESTEQ